MKEHERPEWASTSSPSRQGEHYTKKWKLEHEFVDHDQSMGDLVSQKHGYHPTFEAAKHHAEKVAGQKLKFKKDSPAMLPYLHTAEVKNPSGGMSEMHIYAPKK